ncbi:MAG: radical SAM protein [bacterium]|nr:radical SAM protein [bacterium]
MKFSSFARFIFTMLTKGSRYGFDFLTIANKRFCNSSNKIIGWHKGYPSFYLLSPPLLSKPFANSLTSRLMSIYQWRKLPDLAGVAVNDACNCSCEYCSFTSMEKNNTSNRPALTTAELKKTLSQIQELGASTINLVGGEPLMHDDIFEIIGSIDKDLSQVILFTNGYFLKEKAKGLRKAGLTSVIVSIDSALPNIHDQKKGLDGLFDKAIEGIRQARKEKLLVGLSTVLLKEDMKNGNLEKIFELGKRLKINGIILFDAIPTGNYAARPDVAWHNDEQEELIKIVEEYHNKNDYPGIHAYSFSKSSRGIGCAGGISHFYISPYGDVCPCDFNPMSTGNVKDEPLHQLWDRFSQYPEFACSSLNGCKMKDETFKEKYLKNKQVCQ